MATYIVIDSADILPGIPLGVYSVDCFVPLLTQYNIPIANVPQHIRTTIDNFNQQEQIYKQMFDEYEKECSAKEKREKEQLKKFNPEKYELFYVKQRKSSKIYGYVLK
jgi:hypothetical protein